MLIINDSSPASVKIGAYYINKRQLSASHVCHISCTTDENIDEDSFNSQILAPVATALSRPSIEGKIDFLVVTKGIPLRIMGMLVVAGAQFTPLGDSVDGRLTCQDIPGLSSPAPNPYFNASYRFSHKRTNLYLTTRLDGYTVADAKALIDHAVEAVPAKGLFVLDGCPARSGADPALSLGHQPPLNKSLDIAGTELRQRGFDVLLDQTPAFIGSKTGLMGYWSWGSNDPAFDETSYRGNTWRPGAIAETAVSTSARTMLPTIGGQSMIADLISSGVTGVKGYVTEPYTIAMARADILFDRYTRGWTLAEAFYCASPVLHWKDVVIGDPLCAPYANTHPLLHSKHMPL